VRGASEKLPKKGLRLQEITYFFGAAKAKISGKMANFW